MSVKFDFYSFLRKSRKELNLSAGYNFTKNLNTNIMYVNVDADQASGETDYNKYLASVEYKF